MLRMYVVPSGASRPPGESGLGVNGSRTACDLIVMPRSRSMSIRSRYCARIERSSTTPVICSIRSASVDLPWSMWAMMQKLRIRAGSVAPITFTPGSSGPGTVFRSSQAGGHRQIAGGLYRPTSARRPRSHPFKGRMWQRRKLHADRITGPDRPATQHDSHHPGLVDRLAVLVLADHFLQQPRLKAVDLLTRVTQPRDDHRGSR